MRRSLFLTFLFILFVLTTQPALSQDASGKADGGEYSTVVVLTSGGTLTGRIIEDHPGDKLVLQRKDGKEFTIPYGKIAAVSRNGELSEEQLQEVRDSLRTAPITGMRPRVQGHMFVSLGDATDIGAQAALGAMVSPKIFLGGGLGFEMDNDNTVAFLPLYAELEFLAGNEEFTPMLYARGGYSLGWLDGTNGSDHGGVRFEAGVGMLKTFSEDRNGFFVQIGYVSQKVSRIPVDLTGTDTTDETKSFVKIAMGVAF